MYELTVTPLLLLAYKRRGTVKRTAVLLIVFAACVPLMVADIVLALTVERKQKSDVSQKYVAGCSTQPLGHVFLYAIAARFRFWSQTENGGRNDDIFRLFLTSSWRSQ